MRSHFSACMIAGATVLMLVLAACGAGVAVEPPITPGATPPTITQPSFVPATSVSVATVVKQPAVATPTFLPLVTGAPTNTAHPRLWITSDDVLRLRTWANASNPVYADGITPLATEAKAAMDRNDVPGKDCGNTAYESYPTEMYAEFFAFMSLIENDVAVRADYAARSRTLLMHVINEAAKGPATAMDFTCDGNTQYPPFRHPDWFTSDRDRARYHGEAFGLTVDWIYPTLTAQDKQTIRQVYLRWSQDIIERGYHHPEPVGATNDPALLANRSQVRYSGNNYFTAHMRNLGLIALSFDPADDPDGKLRGYLNIATGAHLYLFDELTRTDSRGGMLPEGFEYSPQTASYAAQFMLALNTTGAAKKNNPLTVNPFWTDVVTGYLHSLSPATITLASAPDVGPVYQPAFYGDSQSYELSDFINLWAPMGLYDARTGNGARLSALRWMAVNTAPGGIEGLITRVAKSDEFRSSIMYFLLLDPAASGSQNTDPHAGMEVNAYAAGMGRLFSRTGWGADAAWFTFALGWNKIDHQMADGNSFSFYRKGEWLTKGRTGYADIAEGIASSEYYDTVGIENTQPPGLDATDWRMDLWKRGSQWNLVNDGDPTLTVSANAQYAFANGDATKLYNSTYQQVTDVTLASRNIVWLKPDHIVVYDRAETLTDGRFKRWWLQLPVAATVNGSRATMTTAGGQQLFVTSVLPEGAAPQSVTAIDQHVESTVAQNEPMKVRLMIEAPGKPKVARFLTVLQGADAGVSADQATLIRSDDGAFDGAAVHGTLVLFAVNAATVANATSFSAPAGVTRVVLTGLQPDAGYTVARNGAKINITAGGATQTDGAGVLVINQ